MTYLPIVPSNNEKALALLKANKSFCDHKCYFWRPIHHIYPNRVILSRTLVMTKTEHGDNYFKRKARFHYFIRQDLCQWRRSGAFIVNFQHISHLFLVFLLLTLNKSILAVMIYRERLIEQFKKTRVPKRHLFTGWSLLQTSCEHLLWSYKLFLIFTASSLLPAWWTYEKFCLMAKPAY